MAAAGAGPSMSRRSSSGTGASGGNNPRLTTGIHRSAAWEIDV
jgi:hypothetical protein